MRKHSIGMTAAAAILVGSGHMALGADYGGDCCADLEERVAELEANTVRKGNRKLKLTISGQVSRSLMYYDDGGDQDVYVVDGPSSSRFRLEGRGKVSKDLAAGYFMEISTSDNGITSLDQNTSSVNKTPSVSAQIVYLESEKLGAISMGYGETATGGALSSNLGGQGVVASADVMGTGGNLFTRSGGNNRLNTATGADNISLRWRRLAPDVGSSDRMMVRYDSPELAGFVLSAAWGENDFWDASIRYANLRNDVRVAAQMGYFVDMNETGRNFGWPADADGDAGGVGNGETRIEEFQASASAQHEPTGIFASAAYQWRTFGGDDPGMLNAACANNIAGATCDNRPDFHYMWTSAGVRRKFNDLGQTSIYAEYAAGWGGVEGLSVGVSTASGGDIDFVTQSRVDVIGIGIVQRIDDASTDLYLGARHYSADVSGLDGNATSTKNVDADIDDTIVIVSGARVKF